MKLLRKKQTQNSCSSKTNHQRLFVEALEPRQMLTTIVPVQGGTTEFTSGGIDFLYITANTDFRQTIQSMSLLEDARDDMDAYYRRNSANGSFIDTFDITPTFDLPQSFTSLGQLTNAMQQAAVNAGFNLSNYTRIGYGFPNPQFPFGGGALGSGNALGGSLWVPDGVWGNYDSGIRGFVHESLHSLGLGHANNYEFQAQIFDEDYNQAVPLDGNVTQAGIDPFHFLGGEGYAGLDADIAAYAKYYIGWIGADNVTVAPADPTGIYRIYEHTNDSIPADRKVALQLGNDPLGQGAIWLSYDPDAANPEINTRGVIATYYRPVSPAVPWALDLTPDSDHPYDPDRPQDNGREARVDFYDSAAVVGETYAMPGFDFKFKVVATGGSGTDAWADIEVKRADVAQVDLNQTNYQFDVGPEGSPISTGYDALLPITAGDVHWSGNVIGVDRGAAATSLERDFVLSSTATTLEHAVRNGLWRVTVTMGDQVAAHDQMSVAAEGVTIASGISSSPGQFIASTFDVEVTDGSLSLTFADEGGSDANWVLNGVSLELLEYRVDATDDVLAYDFGPEGQLLFDPLQNFLAPEAIGPEAAGDIGWSGTLQAKLNAPIIVVDGEQIDLGELNDGIVGDDSPSLSGTGYIMYSEEQILSRFASNPPTGGEISSNLVLVRYRSGQWEYSNNQNNVWFAFSTAPADRLIATINFSTDIASTLEGQRSVINGIDAGYDSGGISVVANSFQGSPNLGEYEVVGGAGQDAGPVESDWVGAEATRTLEHKVRNGVWRVTLRMGDAVARDNMQVRAEGNLIASNIDTAAQQYVYVRQGGASTTETSFDVVVTDGSLSLEFSDNGGFDTGWVLNGMELERVGVIVDTSDTSFAYDLGSVYTTIEPGFDRLTEDFTQGDVRFTGGSVDDRDRHTYIALTDPQPQFRDFVFADSTRRLEHAVANGTWRVTMTLGDSLPPNAVSNVSVSAEGELIASGISTSSNSSGPLPVQGLVYVTRSGASTTRASFDVEVTDGSLSLDLTGRWRLSSLELSRVDAPAIPGDYDYNSTVDEHDYTVWSANLGDDSLVAGTGADGNGDGIVSVGDYTIWRDNLGSVANLNVGGVRQPNSGQSSGSLPVLLAGEPAIDDSAPRLGPALQSTSSSIEISTTAASLSADLSSENRLVENASLLLLHESHAGDRPDAEDAPLSYAEASDKSTKSADGVGLIAMAVDAAIDELDFGRF